MTGNMPSDAGDRLMSIYKQLYSHYGDLGWWPASTPYEVIAGAVLTQNTAWGNVAMAIANFGDRLSPELVLSTDRSELAEIIKPSGFFNQKAGYLKSVTAWFAGYGFDVDAVRQEPLDKLRHELLSTKGIGQETADSILLYAFGFPTFVVDAYTIRLCERFPIDAGAGYSKVKAFFESSIPRSVEVYNNYHALIVINGKEHCKKKPRCVGCPLYYMCGKVAVNS